MSLLVVVVLVALWAALLLPPAVRQRVERSPATSVDSFHRSMGVLASDRLRYLHGEPPLRPGPPPRTRPRRPAPRRRPQSSGETSMPTGAVGPPRRSPAGRASAAERRRRILTGLAGAVGGTGLLASAGGGPFVALFWLAVLLATGYVGLLLYVRANQLEARAKVHRLPTRSAGPAHSRNLGISRVVPEDHAVGMP